MNGARFVFDKENPLMDEVITIWVLGLVQKQKVTIKADITYGGYTFIAYGCFSANEKGEIDMSQSPSEAGTYTGVSPMGLFWSMEAAPGEPEGVNLRCKNVSLPFVYNIEAHDDHTDFKQELRSGQTKLCSAVIKRWYMAKDVQRVLVRSGRVRGALFLPPGQGPFAGVIDMFGSVGSLFDFRAALLSSKGFAVLCLPYFNFDDLPNYLKDIRLEYFMEAADWLSAHRSVISDSLGIIGISKGGEIALQLAYYSNKIKTVVSINGAPFITTEPLHYDGERIGHSFTDETKLITTDEGLSCKHIFICDPKDYLPLWEKDVNVLLVTSGDDLCLNPAILKQYQDRYPAHLRHKCERIQYEGAGHLVEPPYAPLARTSVRYLEGSDPNDRNKKEKIMILWGGQKVQHADAQEQCWNKVIQHFRQCLTPKSNIDNNTEQNVIKRSKQSRL